MNAGWFKVASSVDLDRGTFHYFRQDKLGSICGAARRYQIQPDAESWPEITIVARTSDSPFCRRCDRTRGVEEGRIQRGPISKTAPDLRAAARVGKGSSAGSAADGHEPALRGSSR